MRLSHAPLVRFSVLMSALLVMSACEGSMEGKEFEENPSGDAGLTPGAMSDSGGLVIHDRDLGSLMPGQDAGIEPLQDAGVPIEDMTPPPCKTPTAVFEREVWPRVAKPVCAGCHVSGGSAEQAGATFLLKEELSVASGELSLDGFFAHNLTQFQAQSRPVGELPLYLSKALGQAHGGGAVVVEGSMEHDALLALQESFERDVEEECEAPEPIEPLDHITLLDGPETLRKATMMLAGRLPSEAELARLEGIQDESAVMAEVESIIQAEVMKGPEFREWLKYAWNEVFNFRGTWQLDVTFHYQVVSQQDYSSRRWGRLNTPAQGCDKSLWVGDDTPLWQRFNYSSQQACEDGTYALRYLSERIAWSLIEEPLEMIAWVIMTDRPFTEILTTKNVMMNYYSSTVYYGSAQPQDNPFVAQYGEGLTSDVIEHPAGSVVDSVELPTLHTFKPMATTRRSRRRKNDQDDQEFYYVEGDIPRAGLLTSQIFLNRYPTTDTNLNRHRAWSYFQNFLGVDILALADRRGDPAEAELGSDQPTIDDANCSVCHNVMDPVAGLFQDFGEDGRWEPDDSWPTRGQPNLVPPGSSTVGSQPNVDFTEQLAGDLTPVQWLSAQTIEDPRFATRMVRHAFLQLTGHDPLSLPLDTDVPGWQGRRVAYETQSSFLAGITEGFVQRDFDMKWVLGQLIISPWYRATGVRDASSVANVDVAASVSGFGDGDQLLTPEHLHRKIEAILERPWQFGQYEMRGTRLNVIDEDAVENDYLLRFNSENDFRYIDPIFRDMYGGIDFFNNIERLDRPSSVMAAVGRRVSNELGCGSVAADFALPSGQRVLFGGLTAQDTVQSNPAGVRRAMSGLMQRMWGSTTPEDLDVAVSLFDTIQSQGAMRVSQGEVEPELLAHCQAIYILPGQSGQFTPVTDDPDYALRAWAAVVSYLALDAKFIYAW